jgi:hypothetical protein
MENPAKKIQLGVTHLLFVVLLFAIVIIELQLVAIQIKIEQLTQAPQQPGVFQTDPEDTGVKPGFQKRTLTFTEESEVANIIHSVKDQDLIGMRCTEVVVNDGGKKYWWRTPYEHDMYEEVVDPVKIRAMDEINESLPHGRTAISARFCETEYNNILVHYVVANEGQFGNRGFYHGIDADAYVTVLDETGGFRDGILVMHEENWPYAICKKPVQLTNSGELYMFCNITSGGNAENSVYVVSLTDGTSSQLLECQYSRVEDRIEEECSEV